MTACAGRVGSLVIYLSIYSTRERGMEVSSADRYQGGGVLSRSWHILRG